MLLLVVIPLVASAFFSTTSSAGITVNFTHGVAARAGTNFAQLWTRSSLSGVEFQLTISDNANLSGGQVFDVTSDAGHDNTVKKMVKGLEPNTRYWYQFSSELNESPLGTFRTFPLNDRARPFELAITGDSDELWQDHPPGPPLRDFAVLDRVREDKPDMFIYMGDTIYSDSETGAPLAATLEEKWDKYKNNRLPATRMALKKLNTWTVWDDHEVVNDFAGAELSVDNPALFNAGVQAFNDYWPIAENRYYRKVNYGKNIDMIFLDERSYRTELADTEGDPCFPTGESVDLAPTMPEESRTELGLDPVDPACLAHIKDPTRTMLGEEQLAWFKDQLKNSDAKWKLIINEVGISQLFVRPYDRWEGYEHERNNILNFIKNQNIENTVFLTTDLHANVGGRLYKDITAKNGEPISYEMITGPIQTCDLDCEIDKILNSNLAGEFLTNFLQDEGLTDADCINIEKYAYGHITADADAKDLFLRWKSHVPANGGGDTVFNCPNVKLPRDYSTPNS